MLAAVFLPLALATGTRAIRVAFSQHGVPDSLLPTGVPEDVQDGYFAGRSGDAIFKPKTLVRLPRCARALGAGILLTSPHLLSPLTARR